MSFYVYPLFQAFDSEGIPLVGGKLYTYEAGTTTPKTTYSDVDQTIANTNPLILDSRGEALPIYGFGWFKFVLDNSDDVTIWTVDNIPGIGCCSQLISFDDTDLVGSAPNRTFTFSHLYEQTHIRCTVFNENGEVTIPKYIDCSSDEEVVIGFGSTTITGTWYARYGL